MLFGSNPSPLLFEGRVNQFLTISQIWFRIRFLESEIDRLQEMVTVHYPSANRIAGIYRGQVTELRAELKKRTPQKKLCQTQMPM